jgi:hypothetical protein
MKRVRDAADIIIPIHDLEIGTKKTIRDLECAGLLAENSSPTCESVARRDDLLHVPNVLDYSDVRTPTFHAGPTPDTAWRDCLSLRDGEARAERGAFPIRSCSLSHIVLVVALEDRPEPELNAGSDSAAGDRPWTLPP